MPLLNGIPCSFHNLSSGIMLHDHSLVFIVILEPLHAKCSGEKDKHLRKQAL